MRTRHLIFAALVGALLLVPVASGQSLGVVGVSASGPCGDVRPVVSNLGDPFGSFDGQVTGGNAVSGIATLVGWALDDVGVAAVDVLVDGFVAGRAQYEVSRPEVSAVFPGYPNTALPGWVFRLDTTRFLNGEHSVTGRVIDTDGQAVELSPKVFLFTNLTHNLKPFGIIDFPNAHATLGGTCDNPGATNRIYSVVDGWVLDAGVENNDHGVGYVELMVDGTVIANSRRDCFHSPVFGGFTNCYGVFRPDVQENYPTLKDSPNAGFRFVLDVGALVDFGYAEGSHVLTIRSGDQDSQVNNVDAVNVNFLCNNGNIDNPSIGAVNPSDDILTVGVTQLSGFALDREGVETVTLLIDGSITGNATYGFPDPAVTQRYPGYPDSMAPGWIFDVSVLGLSDGVHSALVVVTDTTGESTVVGQQDFRVLVR